MDVSSWRKGGHAARDFHTWYFLVFFAIFRSSFSVDPLEIFSANALARKSWKQVKTCYHLNYALMLRHFDYNVLR